MQANNVERVSQKGFQRVQIPFIFGCCGQVASPDATMLVGEGRAKLTDSKYKESVEFYPPRQGYFEFFEAKNSDIAEPELELGSWILGLFFRSTIIRALTQFSPLFLPTD